MSEHNIGCLQCGRNIIQSISNRCMYCGVNLPEEHHLSDQQKLDLLEAKMARFRETEENADQIVNSLRQDFSIPKQWKPAKKRKIESQDAVFDALDSITSSTGRLWVERGEDRRHAVSTLSESDIVVEERRSAGRRHDSTDSTKI